MATLWRPAGKAQKVEELAPRLRPPGAEVRLGPLEIRLLLPRDAVARDDLLHLGGGNAVHLGGVQAEDLGAQASGHLRIAESLSQRGMDLERPERLDLVLRRAVPDRVGAPQHVVFPTVAHELAER